MEKLYESEFRLMEVLWDSQPVNSTQLVHLCQARLGWNKSTTYTVLRKLCQKGAAKNESATVTAVLTREQVIRARGEELVRQAGGVAPFLTAFFGGRKLSEREAQALKDLIDRSMGEGEP
jgi:predicted transcriptional regulator